MAREEHVLMRCPIDGSKVIPAAEGISGNGPYKCTGSRGTHRFRLEIGFWSEMDSQDQYPVRMIEVGYIEPLKPLAQHGPALRQLVYPRIDMPGVQIRQGGEPEQSTWMWCAHCYHTFIAGEVLVALVNNQFDQRVLSIYCPREGYGKPCMLGPENFHFWLPNDMPRSLWPQYPDVPDRRYRYPGLHNVPDAFLDQVAPEARGY